MIWSWPGTPSLTSKPLLTIALKILKTIEKPLVPMVGPPKKHSMVMVQLCQNHWKTIDGNGGLKKTLTIPSPWKIDHRCGLLWWLDGGTKVLRVEFRPQRWSIFQGNGMVNVFFLGHHCRQWFFNGFDKVGPSPLNVFWGVQPLEPMVFRWFSKFWGQWSTMVLVWFVTAMCGNKYQRRLTIDFTTTKPNQDCNCDHRIVQLF